MDGAAAMAGLFSEQASAAGGLGCVQTCAVSLTALRLYVTLPAVFNRINTSWVNSAREHPVHRGQGSPKGQSDRVAGRAISQADGSRWDSTLESSCDAGRTPME